MDLSRRSLLKGAMLGGIASALPPGVRLAFAGSGASNIIVFALMRGAMDGLNLVAPADDPDLIAARPATLRLTSSGAGAGLPLANGPSQNDWRLHPAAPELKALYDSGALAFIHASGIPADSRSHFEMQAFLEHGVADAVSLNRANGWIGQYALNTAIAASTFSLVSAAPTPPASMSGDQNAISLPNPNQFTLGSAARARFLQSAYAAGAGLVAGQGSVAINAVNAFQSLHSAFDPPKAGTYPADSFSQGLSVIAELIKLNVGLQVAEVEYTSWDTHVNQQPRFAACATVLSKGLGAFYDDIAAYAGQVTVVVVSEFGRRVQSNASGGTDHGHGNVMLVLGGSVNGGQIYGDWLGLNGSVLDLGDVPVTTDYRSVLTEVITGLRGPPPAGVFPNFRPGPSLGLIKA
jgi:uncharacterized protein (DUF1501 family)